MTQTPQDLQNNATNHAQPNSGGGVRSPLELATMAKYGKGTELPKDMRALIELSKTHGTTTSVKQPDGSIKITSKIVTGAFEKTINMLIPANLIGKNVDIDLSDLPPIFKGELYDSTPDREL
jgi:hypothetical protein